MAVVLKLIYSPLNDGADCGTMIIDDDTGVYNVTTNPNGYQDEGGDASNNAKRSELALYQIPTKMNPEGTDSDLDYTNVDSSAETVASWSVDITSDGWYRGQVIGAPVWDTSLAYGVQQLVWYDDLLYTCLITTGPSESPSTAPTKWLAMASTVDNLRLVYDDPIPYGPTVTIATSYYDFLQYCYGDETYADAWKDASDDRPSFYTKDSAIAITAFLEGAKIAAARENFQEADRKILIVQDLGNNPNCKTC